MTLLAASFFDLGRIQPIGSPSFDSPGQIVATIFNFVILIAGVTFVCIILFAGLTYLLGAGTDQVDKAKKQLFAAVVGLFITLSAWGFGTFVLYKLNNGGFTRPATHRPTATTTTSPSATATATNSPDPQATVLTDTDELPSPEPGEQLVRASFAVRTSGTKAGLPVYLLPAGSFATSKLAAEAAKLDHQVTDANGQVTLRFYDNPNDHIEPRFRVLVFVTDAQAHGGIYSATELASDNASIDL